MPRRKKKQKTKEISFIDKVLSDKFLMSILKEKIKEDLFEDIFKILAKGKEIDLKIAEILKVEPNVVRAILYKMKDLGIADFDKKKRENINWYDFIWYLREDKIREFFKTYFTKKIEELEKTIKEIEGYAFYCKNCKLYFSYVEAMDNEFKCPYCLSDLEVIEDKEEIKKNIDKIIEKYKKYLEDLGLK